MRLCVTNVYLYVYNLYFMLYFVIYSVSKSRYALIYEDVCIKPIVSVVVNMLFNLEDE